MKELTEDVVVKAFKSTNGEYAWRRVDIEKALNAIAKSGQTILGGEVWAIVERRIIGMIPSRVDEPPGIWTWDTLPRRQEESWSNYCIRTAIESNEKVIAMPLEKEVHPSYVNNLFINVTYIDKEEWKEDNRKVDSDDKCNAS